MSEVIPHLEDDCLFLINGFLCISDNSYNTAFKEQNGNYK